MATLRIVEGRATSPEFEIGDAVTIGRGEENAVRLYDETSSRRHAEVCRDGEGFRVRDLGSSNGTFCNGARVRDAVLADGDEIVVGATRLVFLSAPAGQRDTVMIAETGTGRVESTLRPADVALAPGNRRVETVYAAGRRFAGALDLPELLDRLCAAVFEALEPDRATAVILEGDEIVQRARRGSGDLVVSRGIVRRVLEGRAAVLVADVPADPALAGRESLATAEVRSVCCAPLFSDDRVIGVAYCDRSDGRFTPDDLQVLMAIVRDATPALENARRFSGVRERVRALEGAVAAETAIVGRSSRLRAVLDLVERAAPTDTTVLIRGETGTGKELVARALHRQSPRRDGPFVAVNCAALVGSLLESELFGHEKGAFTGALKRNPGKLEMADGGTLFLDEIGEMALETQAALLRALQEREFFRVGGIRAVKVDIRVVAATNKDLETQFKNGAFREDLYYRISVVSVDMPPLRERLDDLPDLTTHFLKRLAQRTAKRSPAVDDAVLAAFRGYRWPGNVRELNNLLERALVLAPGDRLTLDLFPPEVRGDARPLVAPGWDEVITLREAERRAIIAALRRTGWTKGETAKLLGCSWPTLNKKIEDYGITKSDTG